jgi:hypothetical protein
MATTILLRHPQSAAYGRRRLTQREPPAANVRSDSPYRALRPPFFAGGYHKIIALRAISRLMRYCNVTYIFDIQRLMGGIHIPDSPNLMRYCNVTHISGNQRLIGVIHIPGGPSLMRYCNVPTFLAART